MKLACFIRSIAIIEYGIDRIFAQGFFKIFKKGKVCGDFAIGIWQSTLQNR